MSLEHAAPQTDLHIPLPAAGDDPWDPHVVHTHYFGMSVPEAAINAFIYIRYQPFFPLSQGGLSIFRGLNHRHPLDADFLDYQATMPWPTVDGNSIETANGLRVDFEEPGRLVHITYTSPDGRTSIDLHQTAVSPLLARGHALPGEELHRNVSAPGGSEQFMHCVGDLVLQGEHFDVDCYVPRDRSWSQVRTEKQGATVIPPIGWSPMYFGKDLIFNSIGYEDPDTDPAWSGLFDLPPDRPSHNFGWISVDGEVRGLNHVRRDVAARHHALGAPVEQTIEAEDDHGRVHRFSGKAIAMSAVPFWPNASFRDSLFRWEAEDGRVAHQTFQEIWFDTVERRLLERATLSGAR